jgi:RecJ-like exonuclease
MAAAKRVKHPDECPACEGLGVTEDTAPERQRSRVDGKNVWRTVRQGSGCPRCMGVGRLEAKSP